MPVAGCASTKAGRSFSATLMTLRLPKISEYRPIDIDSG
jgi:hypothetical protein